MGTNLRLPSEMADALRKVAARRGQSQQSLVREAIAKELGLDAGSLSPMANAVRSGLVEEPTAFRDVEPVLRLARGANSLELLDRDDR